jgi:hypothetical protein
MPDYGRLINTFCDSASTAKESALASWMQTGARNLQALGAASAAFEGPGSRQLVKLIPLFREAGRRCCMCQVLAAGGWGSAALGALLPGIDCALFAGKLADDFDNHSIIMSRIISPHQFTRTFTGLQVISRSLPGSGRLQAGKAFIEKQIAELAPMVSTAPHEAFEGSPYDHENTKLADTVALAAAHLALVLAVELTMLAQSQYGLKLEHTFDADTAEFEAAFGTQAASLAQLSAEHATLLEFVGLWPQR